MSQVEDSDTKNLKKIITQIWLRFTHIGALREYGNGNDYDPDSTTAPNEKDIDAFWILMQFRVYFAFISFVTSYIITNLLYNRLINTKTSKEENIMMILYAGIAIYLIISMLFFHSRLKP
mgnify:CR=1 FL=1